jgi:hypothetical protein
MKGGAKGVTIRPQKQGSDRYAFVEFEEASGAAAAIEAGAYTRPPQSST